MKQWKEHAALFEEILNWIIDLDLPLRSQGKRNPGVKKYARFFVLAGVCKYSSKKADCRTYTVERGRGGL